MKKTNRVIMIIVAVLLTLVLLSTSLVSGIFAKYVITKDATTTVSFKKFGIQLTISKGSDVTGTITMNPTTPSASTTSATVTGIQLVPGQTLDELVRFDIAVVSGATVSVDTRVKIKAEIKNAANLKSTSSSSSARYVPVEFTATKNDATSYTKIADAWQTATSETALQTAVNTSLKSGLLTFLGTGATADGDYACLKIASAGETATNNLTIRALEFGYHYPATSTVNNSDAIMTYIAEQGGTFDVTYTVVLEQIV